MIRIQTTTIPKREGGGDTTIINNGRGNVNTDLLGHSFWGQYYTGEDIKGTLYDVHNIYADGNVNVDGSVNTHGVQAENIDTKKISASQEVNIVSELYKPRIMMGYDVSNIDNNISIHVCNDEGFYFTDKDRNLGFGIMPDYIACGLDIGSTNFYSGIQGWRVTNDGTAEFQNLKVNGNLDVYSITYNEMKATNGILLVTDSAQIIKARLDESNNDWIITTDEFPPFAVDDIVQVQYKVSQTRIFQMKGEVKSVNQDGENTVRITPYDTETGFSYQATGTSVDRLGVTKFTGIDIETCQGKYIIRIGNKSDANRQTVIKLNPYDGGYIDFLSDCSTLASAASNDSTANSNKGKSKTRVGQLSGIVYNGQALSGYGLYSDNVYLTGGIRNLDGKWSLNRDGSGQVANNNIYWDASGNLTIKLHDSSTLEDRLAYLSVTDSCIYSRVQTIEGDYVTGSELTQTAEQISLSVYNGISEDLERTGIDISSGHIYIDAQNTTFSGNIVMENPNEGLILKDSNGNARINILNNTLGTLDNFDFGINNNVYSRDSSKYETAQTSVSHTFETGTLGTLTAGQKLQLSDMGLDGFFWADPNERNFASVQYSYTIKCGSTSVTTQSGTATLDTTARYPYTIPSYTINSVSSAGTYTITMTCTFSIRSGETNKGDFHFYYFVNAHSPASSINRIATDGAVFASGPETYNWMGSDYTQIRNGNQAIRVKDGKLERNSYNAGAHTFGTYWSDLSSTMPYRILNVASHTATLDDCIIVFSTIIGENPNRTLTLPAPNTCPGKIYFVKNLNNAQCTI